MLGNSVMSEESLLCLFVFFVAGVLLFLGKIYDQGLPTDKERVIYPEGPECDDGENMAEICSPFEYKGPEDTRTAATVESSPIIEEKGEALALQNVIPQEKETKEFELREVRLKDFVDNKTSKTE